MEDKDRRTLDGSLGYFWENADPSMEGSASVEGFLQEVEGGAVQIEHFLDEDSAPFTGRKKPVSIFGSTANGHVLVLDVFRTGETLRYGAGLPSVRQYNARTAVFGVPPVDADGDNVHSVQAFFPGITRWSGMQTLREEARHDDQSRAKSVTLHVEAAEELSQQLSGGRTLSLSSH